VTYGQAKKATGPIKIGGQGAISGAHADYGWQMMAGATLAIEQINTKGGILGRKLELKFMDEELKPATAVKNARYLVTDWGADFLFGIDSSGSAMAVGPVLPELDRLCFVTHGATHRLTEELVASKGIKQIFRMVAPVYQDALWLPGSSKTIQKLNVGRASTAIMNTDMWLGICLKKISENSVRMWNLLQRPGHPSGPWTFHPISQQSWLKSLMPFLPLHGLVKGSCS
jgi:hypothetical protein